MSKIMVKLSFHDIIDQSCLRRSTFPLLLTRPQLKLTTQRPVLSVKNIRHQLYHMIKRPNEKNIAVLKK